MKTKEGNTKLVTLKGYKALVILRDDSRQEPLVYGFSNIKDAISFHELLKQKIEAIIAIVAE